MCTSAIYQNIKKTYGQKSHNVSSMWRKSTIVEMNGTHVICFCINTEITSKWLYGINTAFVSVRTKIIHINGQQYQKMYERLSGLSHSLNDSKTGPCLKINPDI